MGAKIKTITNFFTITSGLLEARVKSLYLRENIHDFPCFNRANIHYPRLALFPELYLFQAVLASMPSHPKSPTCSNDPQKAEQSNPTPIVTMFATAFLVLASVASFVSAQNTPAWCQNLANPVDDNNPRFQLVAINRTESAEAERLSLISSGEELYSVATASSGSNDDGFGPFFSLRNGNLFALNDQTGGSVRTNGPGPATNPKLTFFNFGIPEIPQIFCETNGLIAVNNVVDKWALCRGGRLPGAPNLLMFNPTEEGGAGDTFIFSTCYPIDLAVLLVN
ncbi:hypothetical protein PNOK_0876300 [Pyrrhoderma noxium]|uniref:Uncharacterized protein n=1 Tax=Pyrrhoderma noxium TaxID=2282107 RepID=A0A286U8L0_9AGAM|nr:hypothetical protein PNOK_0876300 [Pyrrhoderma noxium]